MTRLIAMLCFEDAQMLDIAGPLEVFARSSRWLQDNRGAEPPPYEVVAVAKRPGQLKLSNGLTLGVVGLDAAAGADTFLISGGIGIDKAVHDTELIAWVRSVAPSARRVAGVCTGTLLLGAAGLLDQKRATTHWAFFPHLRKIAPTCEIDQTSIFVKSGKIITSAGVTAGMDMALALVEEDFGKDTALHVAQELVMYLRRPGGQAQFSRFFEAELRDSPLAALERWVLENLSADLSVASMARRIGRSERFLYRAFKEEKGCGPAAWIRQLRIEHARREMELGAHSLKDVARRSGLGDEQALRRAFRRSLGVTPSDYSARFF